MIKISLPLKLLGLTLSVATSAAVVSAKPYQSLFVFGDSLSDIGQVYRVSKQTIPPPLLYSQGRFSNGAVWVQDLADTLQVPLTLANNYAFGGAETGTGNYAGNKLPGLRDEVRFFVEAHPQANPNALYVVWAGGNDYLDGQTNPDIPVANLMQSIQALIDTGVQDVLVSNLPDLGKIPDSLNTPHAQFLSQLTLDHNTRLRQALDSLRQSSGINIFLMDSYTLFNTMISNPTQYGLSNVTEACLLTTLACTRNPDSFLFWDTIHPTRVGHSYAAQLAVTTLQNP